MNTLGQQAEGDAPAQVPAPAHARDPLEEGEGEAGDQHQRSERAWDVPGGQAPLDAHRQRRLRSSVSTWARSAL